MFNPGKVLTVQASDQSTCNNKTLSSVNNTFKEGIFSCYFSL